MREAATPGTKQRSGSKAHAAVATLGHLLTLHGTAADEQERAPVETLAQTVQQITGEHASSGKDDARTHSRQQVDDREDGAGFRIVREDVPVEVAQPAPAGR